MVVPRPHGGRDRRRLGCGRVPRGPTREHQPRGGFCARGAGLGGGAQRLVSGCGAPDRVSPASTSRTGAFCGK